MTVGPHVDEANAKVRQTRSTFGRRWALVLAGILVPLLQLLQSLLTLARLPEFWRFYADPPYMYLFNSLSLGTGLTPQHVDHPGTSLQWLMAGVERLTYLVGGAQDSLPADVAWRPELYLSVTGVVLAAIFAASSAFFGISVVRSFGDFPGAVAAVAILAGSGLTVPWIVTATPEALVASCALFIVAAMAPTFKDRSLQPSWLAMTLIAVAFAVAVTAKITVLPLAIVFPFVLVWRRLLAGAAIAGAVALVILIPVFELMPRMFGWFTNLARSTGRYGGESPTSMTSNVSAGLTTVASEHVLTWIVLVALVIAVVLRVRGKREGIPVASLLGVGAAIAATLAVSFKESTDRDFMVLIALAPIGLALSLSEFLGAEAGRAGEHRSRIVLVGGTALGLVGALAVVQNIGSFRELGDIQQKSGRVVAAMAEATDVDGTVIHSFLAANEFYPLMLGSEWAYHPYSDEILARFPDNLYYNPFLSTVFGKKEDGTAGYVDCREMEPLAEAGQLTFVLPGDHSPSGPLGTTEITLQDGSILEFDSKQVRVVQDSLSVIPITNCLAPE